MWETPKTDWKNSDAVNFETTFQRIEGNIAYLKFLLR
jgi:hypothetical protein